MTVSLKDMIARQPPEIQKKIRARSAELIAEELARVKRQQAIPAYHLFVDAKGDWCWQLVAPTGKILATSWEGYKTKRLCVASINRVRSAATSQHMVVEAA